MSSNLKYLQFLFDLPKHFSSKIVLLENIEILKLTVNTINSNVLNTISGIDEVIYECKNSRSNVFNFFVQIY